MRKNIVAKEQVKKSDSKIKNNKKDWKQEN
jgi:hypothetical protein